MEINPGRSWSVNPLQSSSGGPDDVRPSALRRRLLSAPSGNSARKQFYGGLVPGLNHGIPVINEPLPAFLSSQEPVTRASLTKFMEQTGKQVHADDDESGYTAIELLLGRNEIGCSAVFGASLTEFNATCIFMYFHIGIVRAANSGEWSHPAFTAAMGHFVLIALLIFAFAAPSGAHFNPNITLATVLIGHTTVYRFTWYLFAQVTGATCGVALMRMTLGWHDTKATDLAECGIGSVLPVSAVVANAIMFHALLCIIGGIAFSEQTAKVFGPVLAPIFIAATVSLIIFSSSQISPGFGPMLNAAECYSVGIVSGTWSGYEWISIAGPAIGCVVYSLLFVFVPPAHQSGYVYEPPLLAPLRKERELGDAMKHATDKL